MPVSWFDKDKAFGVARSVKTLLNRKSGGATPDAEQREERATSQSGSRPSESERKKMLRNKRQELRRTRRKKHAAKDYDERMEYSKRHKRLQWEIFQVQRQLGIIMEGRSSDEPGMGALPDFAVIGAAKCGTTFLYKRLTQHPYVEPAATKELHFFDLLFDEGTEWYRRFFPQPRCKDGRRTITGEATPLLAHHLAPERMADVVPQARLIVLLRNPVDRAYSLYQHWRTRGVETLTFEAAIEGESASLRGTSPHEDYADLADPPFEYLSRSVYVDQLVRWSEFFDREQMLVLKSEDFFERQRETLKHVYEFLGLPDWEPDAPEQPSNESDKQKYDRRKRNKGRYDEKMDPATRQRLEEFFEPHNRRLYKYLGVDFGW